MTRSIRDLTGQSFGEWTVLHMHPERSKNGSVQWACSCSCGATKIILGDNLVRGRSTKCQDCRAASMRREPKAKLVKPRIKLVGNRHHRWRGNTIVYASAHKRVAAARGPARDQACVDCGEPAQDWSFTKVECETRMSSPDGRPYCTHVEHYDPRCRTCHNRFDHP